MCQSNLSGQMIDYCSFGIRRETFFCGANTFVILMKLIIRRIKWLLMSKTYYQKPQNWLWTPRFQFLRDSIGIKSQWNLSRRIKRSCSKGDYKEAKQKLIKMSSTALIQDVFRISIKLPILLMCVSINQNKIKSFLSGIKLYTTS